MTAIKKNISKNVLGKIKVDLHKILIIWGASCWGAKWVVSKVAEEPSVPRDRNVSAAEAGHTSECLKGRSQAAQQAQLAESISFFIINIIFFSVGNIFHQIFNIIILRKPNNDDAKSP